MSGPEQRNSRVQSRAELGQVGRLQGELAGVPSSSLTLGLVQCPGFPPGKFLREGRAGISVSVSCCSKSPWLRVCLECSWEVGGKGGGKGGGGYRNFGMDLDSRMEKEKREGGDRKWAISERGIKGRWCVLVLSFTVLL